MVSTSASSGSGSSPTSGANVFRHLRNIETADPDPVGIVLGNAALGPPHCRVTTGQLCEPFPQTLLLLMAIQAPRHGAEFMFLTSDFVIFRAERSGRDA